MFVKKFRRMRHLYLLLLILLLSLPSFGATAMTDTMPDLQKKYQSALELINAFQFDQAQQLLSECYIREPENLDYLLKIAYCNQQSGRYPDAKIFYEKVLKIDSVNTNALSSLGMIYERENNYRRAGDYYDHLISIDSTNAYYYKRRGYVAIRQNSPLQSVFLFLRAHQLNEADIETIDQLCDLYLALNDLASAEKMVNRGLNIDPNNIKLLYNLARLETKRDRHEAVVKAVTKAMALGDTSDYYQMMLGVAYLHLDSLENAIFHLSALEDRGKDTEYTHHYLGLAHHGLGDNEQSIHHFNKAIELGVSEKMADFHADLAAVHSSENRHRKAIEHYRKALQHQPRPRHIFHLARSCDQYYKDKQIALQYYEQYLATGDRQFREYTEQRIKQLNEYLHFSK